MSEQNKIISDFPSYMIDVNGNITSIRTGKILKPWEGSGYWKVSLRHNNQTVRCYVHRLLAQTFIPNPKNLPTVNHKNGDRKDNRLVNIEWSSYVDQELHKNRIINKRKRGAFYQHNGWISAITVDGKVIYLGRFKNKEDAHGAYYEKYIEVRGKKPW